MLKLENLTIRFGGLTAVDNVTTHVEQGEIFGLVGPNGAGKTTTFNMISGYYAPTRGKVIFDGQEIQGKPQYEINRLGIARTYQNINLFNKMTVLENCMIGCHPRMKANIFDAIFNTPRKRREDADPAVQDLDATLKEAGIRNNIHVAIECVGATPTCQTTVDYVKIQGRIVWVGNAAKMITVNMQNIVTQELKIFGSYAFTEEDFSSSLRLLAERKLPAAEIITRIVTLEHATETFEELTKGGSKDIKVLVDVNG